MMLWAVYRDGKPEKCADEIEEQAIEQYRRTGDVALLIIARSVINVFDEKDLAQVCKSALERDYPEEKFSLVELHPITGTVEWS